MVGSWRLIWALLFIRSGPLMVTCTHSWLGRLGNGAPMMDEEAARRYRQRVFQMGLLVCLFLLFVDSRGAATTGNGGFGDASSGTGAGAANASTSPSASAHGGGLDDDWVVQGIPEAQTERLQHFLQLQPWDGAFCAVLSVGRIAKTYVD